MIFGSVDRNKFSAFKNIKGKLLSIPGITDIHDLHIWTITSGYPALSGHLDVKKSANRDAILQKATSILKEEFAIEHLTLQLKGEDVNLKKEEHHWHWD
jgi:cobalt-zinc-cadmium efflux system protein